MSRRGMVSPAKDRYAAYLIKARRKLSTNRLIR
jgi:hypothetical protein